MKEVWDVKRPPRTLRKPLTNEELILELWSRGVTIEKIFASYYELEEQGNHQEDLLNRLTVGDVELLGFTEPSSPRPF